MTASSDLNDGVLNRPMRLSHGTMGFKSLARARPFLEEFLGMECVRHGRNTMIARKGGYWGIVCMEIGDKAQQLGLWNHWGLDMHSKEDVDHAHAMALKYKDKYGLDRITPVGMRHGTYQFHFRDLDGNWWEFQYVDVDRYDQFFAGGDRYSMDSPSVPIRKSAGDAEAR